MTQIPYTISESLDHHAIVLFSDGVTADHLAARVADPGGSTIRIEINDLMIMLNEAYVAGMRRNLRLIEETVNELGY